MSPSIKAAKSSLTFFDVLKFAAGYWFRQPIKLSVVLLMVLISSFLETYLPSALSAFLTAIKYHQSKTEILSCLVIFLGTYLVQTMLFSLVFLFYNTFETTIFKSLADDVFAHIYSLPENYFANTFTGSIVSKVNRARQKIEVFEDQILLRIFSTVIILIGSILFLMLQFPLLALLVVFYLILLVIVSAFFIFKVSGPAQGIYAEAQDNFSAHLADSISGVSPTKSYAQEPYEVSRFLNVTSKLRVVNLRAYRLMNMAGLMQGLLLSGMLAVLMGGGTWYYFKGQATVENMAYLAFAYTIMQSYVREIGDNIKNLLTSSYDLHGVIALLQEKPETDINEPLPELKIQHGEIVFDQVEFTYPNKSVPIFKNLSTTIHAGERIALVGHSGGGKTSFIRLLQALFPVQKGHIYIDGQDINFYSRSSLRRSISLVPQEPILFHRTIRENIAYAKPHATDAEICAAAKRAHIENLF